MGWGQFVSSLGGQRYAQGRTLFGLVPDVDAAEVTSTGVSIWDRGGLYPFDTTPAAVSVVSNSASDADGGTGARTVRVYGLGTDNCPVEETVTMAGLTPVLTLQTFAFVYEVRVVLVGSQGRSAGEVVASISATDVAVVLPGFGQSHGAQFRVPATWTSGALVAKVWGQVPDASNAGGVISIRSRVAGESWRSEALLGVSSRTFTSFSPDVGNILAAGTDIDLVITQVDQSNRDFTGGWSLIRI